MEWGMLTYALYPSVLLLFLLVLHPRTRSIKQIDTGEWALVCGAKVSGGWPRGGGTTANNRGGFDFMDERWDVVGDRTTANSLGGGVRGGFVFVESMVVDRRRRW